MFQQVALALLVSAGICSAMPHQLSAPTCSATFQVVKSASRANFCLDISGVSKDSGAPLIAYTCLPDKSNQQFYYDDKNRLVARHSGKCVDVKGGATGNLGEVIQWDCHDGLNQKWDLDSQGRLHPRNAPNKCLDITGGSQADGTKLIIYDCHNGLNQKWSITPDFRSIKSASRANFCLDIYGAEQSNGTPLIAYTCGATAPNQKFLLDEKNRLVARHSCKCLDVRGAGTADLTDVLQWECHDGDHQKWDFDAQGRLHPRHAPNKCLDITGGSTNDGTKLIIYSCGEGANQKWRTEA